MKEEEDDEELKEYIFIYEDGKALMKEVKTGIQDNMFIQIVEGLETDQEVIVGPYRAVSKKLKDGDAVKKVDKKAQVGDLPWYQIHGYSFPDFLKNGVDNIKFFSVKF